MTNRWITASLTAGLALALAACNAEPATGDAVGEMLEEVPAPQDTPIEATGDLPDAEAGAGADDSTSSPSSGQSDGMVSGSNDDAAARRPDSKNSQLIKADPQ